MKRSMLPLLSVAALVMFASLSFAQNTKSPAQSVRQLGPAGNTINAGLINGCSNCLAYGGDLDPNSPNANGLASEKDVIVSDAEVVWPIVIPSGKNAVAVRIIGNFLTLGCVADPQQADWDIRVNVSSGNGGTVIASGTNSILIAPTGRSAFGLIECRVQVSLPKPVVLSPGTYYFGLVPYCTNTGNSTCLGQRYFLSDSPDAPPINGRGDAPANDSFFNSGFFAADWQPTWGPTGACGGIGCNRFSAGVIGTTVP